MIAATPAGFLKAAAANRASVKQSAEGKVVSFTLPNGHHMEGVIDADERVAHVRTWLEQSIVGDMLVELANVAIGPE